jgi:hypothetical protein
MTPRARQQRTGHAARGLVPDHETEGLLTLAMAVQVIVTAAALLASYAVTGATRFGPPQLVALLASAAVAVLIARLCTRAIEASLEKRTAVQLAEQAQSNAQLTQAVIKTALDAFVQTDAMESFWNGASRPRL